jgi:hypothetical protein
MQTLAGLMNRGAAAASAAKGAVRATEERQAIAGQEPRSANPRSRSMSALQMRPPKCGNLVREELPLPAPDIRRGPK